MAIYQVFHKQPPTDSSFCPGTTPILVGMEDAEIPLKTRDYFPSTSRLNPLFGEVEAQQYIMNFDNDDIKGLCTYRRWINETSIPDGYDGIAVPMRLGNTVFENYRNCHIADDLNNAKVATLSMYPSYEDDWHRIIERGTTLYYGGGCILRGREFDRYSVWLFSILNGLNTYYKFATMEDVERYIASKTRSNVEYQCRFFGFLAERLTTLYFKRNLRIYNTEYKFIE